jgi:hypothetical protein
VKFYVGDSHNNNNNSNNNNNNKKKDNSINGIPLQEKAPTFYKDLTEETSGVRAGIDGTDRWGNRNGVRQFNI